MIHDIEPAPVNHHQSLELRIGRLETEMKWIYSMVSSHETTLHPEPVTDRDVFVDVVMQDAYEHPQDQWQQGYNRGLRRAARLIADHLNAERSKP